MPGVPVGSDSARRQDRVPGDQVAEEDVAFDEKRVCGIENVDAFDVALPARQQPPHRADHAFSWGRDGGGRPQPAVERLALETVIGVGVAVLGQTSPLKLGARREHAVAHAAGPPPGSGCLVVGEVVSTQRRHAQPVGGLAAAAKLWRQVIGGGSAPREKRE
ncbi:hypothetical protein VTI74DRAFT_87 [Chaetomium olivicolor]